MMKITELHTRIFITIAILAIFSSRASAGLITYEVEIHTDELIGHPAGPFSVEFQLNDGSGSGNASNHATLSDFDFGGGGPLGSPISTGGAAGNALTVVTLTDTSFMNQFMQAFNPGTQLAFRLALTTNIELGSVPDQFSFAILDSSGNELPALSFFDVFLLIDINADNSLVQAFRSDISRLPGTGGPPIDIPAPTVTLVPEPATGLLVVVAVGYGLIARGWRDRTHGS